MKRGYIFSAIVLCALGAGIATWTARAATQEAPVPTAIVAVPAKAEETTAAAAAPVEPDEKPFDSIGEGFARPTFRELVQTRVLLNGYDIMNPKVADEYGRVVYCRLYNENFRNDVMWNKIRNQIISRIHKKTEPYRIRYEIVIPFRLGRYDFKNQFFPVETEGSAEAGSLKNIGSISLSPLEKDTTDCKDAQRMSIFSTEVSVRFATPLTIKGFHVPIDKVEKMMVRIEEAGNAQRMVYGRVRMIIMESPLVTDMRGGVRSFVQGDVESVVFFLDKELMKPVGRLQFGRR